MTRRAVNASRLSFPLQLVIGIVMSVLSLAGGYLGMALSQQTLRSDVRDILTRMDAQERQQRERFDAQERQQRERDAAIAKLDEARSKLQDERAAALNAAIDTLDKQQKYQQTQIQELRADILKGGRR